MARMIPHACGWPGCPKLAEPGHRYCAEHEKLARAGSQREYDQRRGTAAQRGYGARWRRLRRMFLNAHPICADPFGVHAKAGEVVPATDVDHIIAKRCGGTDTWENLQALCHSCHSRKTAAENCQGRGVSISGASRP